MCPVQSSLVTCCWRTHRPMVRARTDGLMAFPYRWLPPKLTEGESSSSQSSKDKLNLKRLSCSWRSTLPVQVSFKILNDTVVNVLLCFYFFSLYFSCCCFLTPPLDCVHYLGLIPTFMRVANKHTKWSRSPVQSPLGAPQ